MKLIVDRFEGNVAVCETPELGHIEILREKMPSGVREGDVIQEQDGVYAVLAEETEKRREKMREKLKGLIKE